MTSVTDLHMTASARAHVLMLLHHKLNFAVRKEEMCLHF